MKTRWYCMKQNMKNWRWWMALPYMLIFVVALGGLYIFGATLEWLGQKMQQPFDGGGNPFFARQVVEFIRRGEK